MPLVLARRDPPVFIGNRTGGQAASGTRDRGIRRRGARYRGTRDRGTGDRGTRDCDTGCVRTRYYEFENTYRMKRLRSLSWQISASRSST